MDKFLNMNKISRKFWNIKDIFEAKGCQKRNITMSSYWHTSPINNSNVVIRKRNIC